MSLTGDYGDFVAALDALEGMICACAIFQTAVGVESAEEAEPFVYWMGEKTYTETPGPRRTVTKTFAPVFATIRLGAGAGLDQTETAAGACWVARVPLEFWLTRMTPEAERGDAKAEARAMLLLAGKLLQQLAAQMYTDSGKLKVERWVLADLVKSDPEEDAEYSEVLIRVER